eukprot:3214192-Pleurochrysis_carterae.AAC.1
MAASEIRAVFAVLAFPLHDLHIRALVLGNEYSQTVSYKSHLSIESLHVSTKPYGLNYGGTAICYSAVGSGGQGYPIQTTHVFI